MLHHLKTVRWLHCFDEDGFAGWGMAEIKVLGLALYGSEAASHRVRLGQYVPGLRERGIDLQIHSLLDNAYVVRRFSGERAVIGDFLAGVWSRVRLLLDSDRFDAAIVHCELLPFFPAWLERQLLKIPYIYDFDDAFFLRYRIGRLSRLSPVLGRKFDSFVRGAAAVTAGNRYLAEYASKHGRNVTVLPSVVDTSVFRPITTGVTQDALTIGWIGSPSTAAYLDQLVEPLSQVATEGPTRLVVIGGRAPSIPGVEVVELPWSSSTEVDDINSFDVGIMPLRNDDWARGKCAFKLIQYMACGIPVIASRVGANVDVVSSDCGVLVDDSDSWVSAIRLMRDDESARKAMSLACRRRAVESYSLDGAVPKLAGVIRSVN